MINCAEGREKTRVADSEWSRPGRHSLAAAQCPVKAKLTLNGAVRPYKRRVTFTYWPQCRVYSRENHFITFT